MTVILKITAVVSHITAAPYDAPSVGENSEQDAKKFKVLPH